jgi:hypothetical protein
VHSRCQDHAFPDAALAQRALYPVMSMCSRCFLVWKFRYSVWNCIWG